MFFDCFDIANSEVAIREKCGLLAYSPLASGYLSGKYRNETYPKGSRMERDWEFWKYRYNTPNMDVLQQHMENEADLIADAGGDPSPEANHITMCSD